MRLRLALASNSRERVRRLCWSGSPAVFRARRGARRAGRRRRWTRILCQPFECAFGAIVKTPKKPDAPLKTESAMISLESIALRDCKVYRQWREAPDGTILQVQINQNDVPIVVLKCHIPNPDHALTSGVIVLESGDDFCRWRSLRSDAAALKLSNYFEIYVEQLAPSNRAELEEIGTLFAHDDGSFFILVGSGETRGYVCVKLSDKHQLGHIYFRIDPENLFDVGRANLKPIDRIERAVGKVLSSQIIASDLSAPRER